MEPVATVHPLTICATALATALVLFALAWVFRVLAGRIAGAAGPLRSPPGRPRRRRGRRDPAVLDDRQRDLLPRRSPPARFLVPRVRRPRRAGAAAAVRSMKTGSAASMVRWDDLGRAGRGVVASTPPPLHWRPRRGHPRGSDPRLRRPARRRNPKGQGAPRARELKRVGGFDRSALVVVTPTGTGWIDPSAIDAVEHSAPRPTWRASVSSTPTSPAAVAAGAAEYGAEAGQRAVQGNLCPLDHPPRDKRPKLYLHGLSLGSMNSERSAELFEMIADPIDGAVWSGPPFESRVWRTVTAARNDGSTAGCRSFATAVWYGS